MLEFVGFVIGIASIDGHAPKQAAAVNAVVRGHDLPGDVGGRHGLDNERGREMLVHRRSEDVAHVVLDGVEMGEDQPGLVADLFLEHTAHVEV